MERKELEKLINVLIKIPPIPEQIPLSEVPQIKSESDEVVLARMREAQRKTMENTKYLRLAEKYIATDCEEMERLVAVQERLGNAGHVELVVSRFSEVMRQVGR